MSRYDNYNTNLISRTRPTEFGMVSSRSGSAPSNPVSSSSDSAASASLAAASASNNNDGGLSTGAQAALGVVGGLAGVGVVVGVAAKAGWVSVPYLTGGFAAHDMGGQTANLL